MTSRFINVSSAEPLRFDSGNIRSSFFYALAKSAIICAIVFLISGCHKKIEAKPTPEQPVTDSVAITAQTPAIAPSGPHPPIAQPMPAKSAVVSAGAADVVTGQLSVELRRYVAYTRTIPKTFEEFTAHDPIKFPPPPSGKKYVIADGKVILK